MAETAKAQMKAWIRQHIQGESEVSIGATASDAIAHFVEDQQFINTLLGEVAKSLIYDITQEVLADTRVFVAGDLITNIDGIKERGQKHAVFSRWMEHAGERHINVMEMKRRDLLVAAQERQERGEHELNLAELWRRMAQRLGPNQKVKSVFTEEQIRGMYEAIAGQGDSAAA